MASSPPAPTPLWNLLRLILRATGPSQQDSAPGGTQLASEPAQVTGFPREQEPRIRLHSSFLPLASPGKTSFPLSQLPSAPTSSLPSGHPPAGLQSSWPGLLQGLLTGAPGPSPPPPPPHPRGRRTTAAHPDAVGGRIAHLAAQEFLHFPEILLVVVLEDNLAPSQPQLRVLGV